MTRPPDRDWDANDWFFFILLVVIVLLVVLKAFGVEGNWL